MVEIGAALAREVELRVIGEAQEVQLPPEENAPLLIRIFENAGFEQQIDQFVSRRFRRVHADSDLVGAGGLTCLAQEIENFEGAIEAARAPVDCNVRHGLRAHRQSLNPDSGHALIAASALLSPTRKRRRLASSLHYYGIVSEIMEKVWKQASGARICRLRRAPASDRRSTVRDRVFGSGRASFCVHIRLIRRASLNYRDRQRMGPATWMKSMRIAAASSPPPGWWPRPLNSA